MNVYTVHRCCYFIYKQIKYFFAGERWSILQPGRRWRHIAVKYCDIVEILEQKIFKHFIRQQVFEKNRYWRLWDWTFGKVHSFWNTIKELRCAAAVSRRIEIEFHSRLFFFLDTNSMNLIIQSTSIELILFFFADIFCHRIGNDEFRSNKFNKLLNKHCNNARRWKRIICFKKISSTIIFSRIWNFDIIKNDLFFFLFAKVWNTIRLFQFTIQVFRTVKQYILYYIECRN